MREHIKAYGVAPTLNTMKIIFLDMDGVMNKHRNYENGYAGISPDCVTNLNSLLDEFTDMVIVVSSAWRYIFHEKDMTPRGFEYMLLIAGVNCKHRVYGYTERDEVIPTRGGQILHWLAQHKNLRISKFLAIDDLDHDFDKLNIPRLKTEAKNGLTAEDVLKAKEYFKST
jgi:hypothetical protein